MLHIIIIVLVLIGLAIHRYLTMFYEQGNLPYSAGFLLFANAFALVYFVSFIWMFGVITGLIVDLLCYLQVIYSAGLWVFSLPGLINIHKMANNFEIPKVNPLAYGMFSLLVILTALLTAINIYISHYKSAWELIDEDIWKAVIILLAFILVGNVARVLLMSRFMKK